MTQPTDEATPRPWRHAGGDAVLSGTDHNLRVVASFENDADRDLAIASVNEIETLRAQLTAATRRAEQAERMLAPFAEAARVNDDDSLSCIDHDDLVIFEASTSWGGYAKITLGDLRAARNLIRSSASGEQG